MSFDDFPDDLDKENAPDEGEEDSSLSGDDNYENDLDLGSLDEAGNSDEFGKSEEIKEDFHKEEINKDIDFASLEPTNQKDDAFNELNKEDSFIKYGEEDEESGLRLKTRKEDPDKFLRKNGKKENTHNEFVYKNGNWQLSDKSSDHHTKSKITKKYGLDPNKKLLIFLQHPVTSEIDDVVDQINQSIVATRKAINVHDIQALAIYSNNDAGGKRIICQLKKSKIKVVPHIVYEDFLRLMNVADVLVGNSSTGIHEAPSFGLPTVNIGSRQQFRERGVNIIDVKNSSQEIFKAIEKSLFDKRFIGKVKRGKNPYDNGDTTRKVIGILENIKLPPIQKVITY